eukprot:m.107603 g.107603  ORF g.107603 m.107603 type:complete len:155 (+) comp16929_c0_seq9:606-1070(+)
MPCTGYVCNCSQDSQNGKLEHLLAVVYNILGTTDPEAGDTGAAGVDVVLARATLQSCYWQRRLQDRKTFPHRGHLTVFATPDALVPSMFHRALLNKSGVGMETRRPGLVTMFRKLASTGLRDPVIVEGFSSPWAVRAHGINDSDLHLVDKRVAP